MNHNSFYSLKASNFDTRGIEELVLGTPFIPPEEIVLREVEGIKRRNEPNLFPYSAFPKPAHQPLYSAFQRNPP